ncbi:carbohydrate binding domain-containing protein, partial [Streptomyces sp. MCAF7]
MDRAAIPRERPDRPGGPRRRLTRFLSAAAAAVLGAGALVALGGSTAGAADANLVQNSGFESGLSGWTCSAASGTTVTSPTHGGSSALKATPAGLDNAQCSQTVSVKPDSSYTL